MKRWGATPEEWAHFKRLALADLLPVVSNPNAPLREDRPLRALGKVPSIYNHNRQAVGLHKWTTRPPTEMFNVNAWAKEPDYGISIRTGDVCAFDCDVPDVRLSRKAAFAFEDGAGVRRGSLPRRSRRGADGEVQGKVALAFRVLSEGAPPRKRAFKVEALDGGKPWLIEFLAQGQQFIAAGTHPNGQRYEWLDGLPEEFPELTLDQVNAGWAKVYALVGMADSEIESSGRSRMTGDDLDVDDPVAEHLMEHWEHYGIRNGSLWVRCPWKENHSDPDLANESEAVWLLAGTNSAAKGHFKCQHTGCQKHTDADFHKAVGYRPAKASEFEDLRKDDQALALYEAMAPGASAKSKELKAERKLSLDKPLPAFDRDGKDQIETNLKNLTRALSAPQAVGCELAYDEFRGELLYAERPEEWQPLTDGYQTELAIRIEDLGFKDQVDITKLRRALDWVSDRQRIDTAKYWLENIVPAWDGVPRIHRFWPDYMQTKDTPYTRALGNYSWTAHAARILDPGCQVDMVPVLVGKEGLGKTSALKAIIPHFSHYGEFNLAKDDEKLARIMRGKLLGELAELRGISVRDAESVLAWITRTEEEWTPKFKEFNTTLARRLVLYGTTNDLEFLQPHMGFRRWLPVLILGFIDRDKIAANCLQLWAEARETYISEGIEYAEVEDLAVAERDAFKHIDPWFDQVNAAIDDAMGEDDDDNVLTMRNCGTLTGERVLIDVLGFDAGRIKKADQQRIGEVLKACGMVRVQRKIAGRNIKVWIDRQLDTGIGSNTATRGANRGREGGNGQK